MYFPDISLVRMASYVRLGRLHCIAAAFSCIDKERLRTTTDMEFYGLSGIHYGGRHKQYEYIFQISASQVMNAVVNVGAAARECPAASAKCDHT
jgi:hypothetical protein